MSFPRYERTKDSGVEWLGEVPAHWEVAPLKHHILCNDGGVWGDDPVGDEGVIVLRSTEQTVDGQWILEDPARRVLTANEISSSLLKVGDLLITKSSGSSLHIGKTTLVSDDIASLGCCYSNFMQRIRLDNNLKPRLVWFLLNNEVARLQFAFLSNSTTGLANLNGSMIGQVWVPIPPPSEQHAIAAFLDRETAKIDNLIAEQKRLVELLTEKRQAVISHAVTKGLDPNAPIKDSGVEWLGEVPAHWSVLKFSREVQIAEGQVQPDVEPYASMVLIAPNHVESGTGRLLLEETAADQGAESGKYLCQQGEVVYSKIRPALAKATIALRDCLCSADMYPMCGRGKVVNTYLCKLLISAPFTAWSVLEADRVAMPKINRESLSNLRIPAPSLPEQKAIAAFLDRETNKIDSLIAEARRGIDLLQERRSALITAAVTGKIDVRGLAA